ncbi:MULTISPECIES: hypothetical protein [unclassified Bartonella]
MMPVMGITENPLSTPNLYAYEEAIQHHHTIYQCPMFVTALGTRDGS